MGVGMGAFPTSTLMAHWSCITPTITTTGLLRNYST